MSGSGAGYSGSGTLTATDEGSGEYQITAMSGTGLQSMFLPGEFKGNDNLLFPTSSLYVDGAGFAFTVTNGSDIDNVDIFSNASAYYAYIVDEDNDTMTIPVTFNLSQTSSMSMMRSSQMGLGTSFQGTSTDFSFSFQPDFQSGDQTPEPSSLVLLGTGMASLGGTAWRRRRV